MMKWIVLGLAIVIGLIFLKLWLLRSQQKEVGNQLFDITFNSIFLGFLLWKGSQVLLDPKLIIESPLSLLYFTGGTKGLVIGIVGAFIYFFYKARKIKIPYITILHSIFVFIFAVMSSSFLMNLFINEAEPKVNTAVSEAIEIGLHAGNRAPDFQLKTVEGADIKLSDLRGKVVILNFWATWCPPCKAEIPHIQNFYDSRDKTMVEILAINLTTSESNQSDVKKFVKDRSMTFPVLLDEDGHISDLYQAITIPTSYLIDTKGMVRKKIVGPMNKDMMNQLIRSIE